MENNKKGLKKLSLQKEEIVNLNDHEMGSAKGGSTWACATIGVVSGTIVGSIAVTYAVHTDWWGDCEPEIKQPSEKVVWDTPHQLCEISEVNVYGYNTQG